jgi:hypothetical protein
VRRTKGGAKGAEAHCPDVKEVEKTFWLIRPDDWVINKKTKRIIMIEFKRASDTAEAYYSDMQSIVERQHTPISGVNSGEAAYTHQNRVHIVSVVCHTVGRNS